MAEAFSDRRTVCQRILTRDDGSVCSDVVIRLLELKSAPEEHLCEYRCAFEIDGLDLHVRDYGYGIDSLEALIRANTKATYALWPFRTQLRWLDGSYDWLIADCMQIRDGGRRRRLRDVLTRDVLTEEDEALEHMVIASGITSASASSTASAATSFQCGR